MPGLGPLGPSDVINLTLTIPTLLLTLATYWHMRRRGYMPRDLEHGADPDAAQGTSANNETSIDDEDDIDTAVVAAPAQPARRRRLVIEPLGSVRGLLHGVYLQRSTTFEETLRMAHLTVGDRGAAGARRGTAGAGAVVDDDDDHDAEWAYAGATSGRER